MKHTWRWFGPNDPISLVDVSQAGATGIVSAMHQVPIGEIWKDDEVAERAAIISKAGFEWSVVESIPVHEAIKIGAPSADGHVEAFVQNLKTVAKYGVRTVCYNFMPVVDWTRTNLSMEMPTGSKALAFNIVELAAFDVCVLKRKNAEQSYQSNVVEAALKLHASWSDDDILAIEQTVIAGLPGSELRHDRKSFLELLENYSGIDESALKDNLRKFIRVVAPVAQELGVNLAIHPDDPPMPLFGLPRVVSTPEDIDWIIKSSPEVENGITFCTGSFGAGEYADLSAWFERIVGRVHFLHLRNVSRSADGSFSEAEHLGGDVDMVSLIAAVLREEKRSSRVVLMRPDHGHLFQRDQDMQSNPGYSYLGRLRGLAELRGVERALMAL